MEKHETPGENGQDVEDIEVDVVNTPTPSCSTVEVVVDDDTNNKATGKTSDSATVTGDSCPPDLVSSISDVQSDVSPLDGPISKKNIQPSEPDQTLPNHVGPDSVVSNSATDDVIVQTSPRRRSGSVGGTADIQRSGSRGNWNGNHGDRPRSGSLGHIDSHDISQVTVSRPRKTTTNFRIVDIVQLPRPRNPGGILPLDDDSCHQALDLIVNEKRGKVRTITEKESLSWTNPSNVNLPNSSLNSAGGQIRRHSDMGSYGVTVTSSTWSSSINEAVERPQPSSVVDSEGVAKKIARLDSSVGSTSGEDLWLGRTGLLPNVRTTAARTPPERPKVPRRQFSPLILNNRTSRQALPSPGRQRVSPVHEISPTSETSRLSTGSVSQSAIDVERMSPDASGQQNRGYSVYSPDDMVPVTSSRNHKCRFCNYSTTSYTQLQYHLARHGGSVKAMKCPLCDYMTNERSNFRRHRRLHARGNQATLLKCGKCSYATTLPYKIREHYHQVHNDMRLTGLPPEIALPENGLYGSPRLLGSRNNLSSMTIHNPCDTSGGQIPYLGYAPFMMNGHTNTYPFPPNNRQPGLNSVDPFMNSAYGILRSRQDGQQSVSNYLRSVMPSAINSHSTPRQATSTLTSSDYFISPVVDTSHHVETLRNHRDIDNTSVSNTVQSSPDIKVKVEPIDVDNHSDVSSTANGYNTLTPDLASQTAEAQPSHQTQLDSVSTSVNHHSNIESQSTITLQRRNIHLSQSLDDANLNTGQGVARSLNLGTMEENNALQRPRGRGLQRSRSCTDVNSSDAYNSFNSSLSSSLKLGTRTVGIQCVLPIVKSERDLNGDFFHHQTFFGQQIRMKGIERGVQCNMNLASRSNLSRQPGTTSQRLSGEGSDLSEHHSSIGGESRCSHCGIVFEDEVMYSIHIGCHSHTDPFICNICGKHCGNKYGFYSHIMRGHHF